MKMASPSTDVQDGQVSDKMASSSTDVQDGQVSSCDSLAVEPEKSSSATDLQLDSYESALHYLEDITRRADYSIRSSEEATRFAEEGAKHLEDAVKHFVDSDEDDRLTQGAHCTEEYVRCIDGSVRYWKEAKDLARDVERRAQLFDSWMEREGCTLQNGDKRRMLDEAAGLKNRAEDSLRRRKEAEVRAQMACRKIVEHSGMPSDPRHRAVLEVAIGSKDLPQQPESLLSFLHDEIDYLEKISSLLPGDTEMSRALVNIYGVTVVNIYGVLRRENTY